MEPWDTLKHLSTMNDRVRHAMQNLGRARCAAAATESGRLPNARDLRQLGINRVVVAAINRV